MGNDGILGVLGNFLTSLLGTGGQGNAAPMDLGGLGEGMADLSLQQLQDSGQLQDTIGKLTPDTGGIFGSAGNFLGKNMAPLGALGLGYGMFNEQRGMNKESQRLARHQQGMADLSQNREWQTYKNQQEDIARMRASGAAPLRQIGRDGQIRTTGESQGFHLPYNEATERYNRIA